MKRKSAARGDAASFAELPAVDDAAKAARESLHALVVMASAGNFEAAYELVAVLADSVHDLNAITKAYPRIGRLSQIWSAWPILFHKHPELRKAEIARVEKLQSSVRKSFSFGTVESRIAYRVFSRLNGERKRGENALPAPTPESKAWCDAIVAYAENEFGKGLNGAFEQHPLFTHHFSNKALARLKPYERRNEVRKRVRADLRQSARAVMKVFGAPNLPP